jgi:hypothetical protein
MLTSVKLKPSSIRARPNRMEGVAPVRVELGAAVIEASLDRLPAHAVCPQPDKLAGIVRHRNGQEEPGQRFVHFVMCCADGGPSLTSASL